VPVASTPTKPTAPTGTVHSAATRLHFRVGPTAPTGTVGLFDRVLQLLWTFINGSLAVRGWEHRYWMFQSALAVGRVMFKATAEAFWHSFIHTNVSEFLSEAEMVANLEVLRDAIFPPEGAPVPDPPTPETEAASLVRVRDALVGLLPPSLKKVGGGLVRCSVLLWPPPHMDSEVELFGVHGFGGRVVQCAWILRESCSVCMDSVVVGSISKEHPHCRCSTCTPTCTPSNALPGKHARTAQFVKVTPPLSHTHAPSLFVAVVAGTRSDCRWA
jgi:hypothetical protein